MRQSAEQGRGEYLEQLGLSFLDVYVLQFYGLPVEEKTILSNTQNTFTVWGGGNKEEREAGRWRLSFFLFHLSQLTD